jgi:hypothetical protein
LSTQASSRWAAWPAHAGRPDETASFAADVPHGYEVVGDEDVAATLLVRYCRGNV